MKNLSTNGGQTWGAALEGWGQSDWIGCLDGRTEMDPSKDQDRHKMSCGGSFNRIILPPWLWNDNNKARDPLNEFLSKAGVHRRHRRAYDKYEFNIIFCCSLNHAATSVHRHSFTTTRATHSDKFNPHGAFCPFTLPGYHHSPLPICRMNRWLTNSETQWLMQLRRGRLRCPRLTSKTSETI